MSIVIKYEEIGKDKIKILKLNALTKDKLPEEYLKQKYCVYLSNGINGLNEKIKFFDSHTSGKYIIVFLEKETYIKDDFYKRLRFIRKAGKKLTKINKAIKLENEKKTKTIIKTITI